MTQQVMLKVMVPTYKNLSFRKDGFGNINDIILFGDKETFAIQLGLQADLEKCKLCFFVKGRKVGSFTKGGELKYSVKAYNTFIANKESYFLPDFEMMTATQIREYFVDSMFELANSTKKEDIEEYDKRHKFYLFLGSQFSNDGCFIKLLYKNDQVIFVYESPKILKTFKYIINYQIFCKVFDEYIYFIDSNKLF